MFGNFGNFGIFGNLDMFGKSGMFGKYGMFGKSCQLGYLGYYSPFFFKSKFSTNRAPYELISSTHFIHVTFPYLFISEELFTNSINEMLTFEDGKTVQMLTTISLNTGVISLHKGIFINSNSFNQNGVSNNLYDIISKSLEIKQSEYGDNSIIGTLRITCYKGTKFEDKTFPYYRYNNIITALKRNYSTGRVTDNSKEYYEFIYKGPFMDKLSTIILSNNTLHDKQRLIETSNMTS